MITENTPLNEWPSKDLMTLHSMLSVLKDENLMASTHEFIDRIRPVIFTAAKDAVMEEIRQEPKIVKPNQPDAQELFEKIKRFVHEGGNIGCSLEQLKTILDKEIN